ncbi:MULTISPECIES: distal tail protein Dit [Bacillus]|uniref:Phage tail component-like protein n=1 Tax=Bacillus capparidis TaxID=1840411 RepID=A0ABS4CUG7_9BACI|nr:MULTISPECIES: distal tail protein Dit [Bacillus]MBP1080801.1 putative phage tail component-like protein [Bacillus capparidis]MED1097445.1 phage tail family protein [Bacillus capparidis]
MITQEMLPNTFKVWFNDIEITQYFYVKTDSGRGIFGREIDMLSVPGRAGGYLRKTNTPVRPINIDCFFSFADEFELRKKLEELNVILHTEEPAPLIFSDEPDRIYYAIFQNVSEGYENKGTYQAELNFVCPDPYKYRATEAVGYYNQETLQSGIVLKNSGAAATPPTFEVTLKDKVTYLDIAGENDYMRVGTSESTEDTPYDKYQKVWESTPTMTGWASASYVPDGGIKTGTMTVQNGDFVATDYGTGIAWHGPAVMQSIGSVLSDYYFRVYFNVSSNHGQLTRCEAYLLNTSGQPIGKLVALVRHASSEVEVEVNIRSGGKSTYFVNQKWKFRSFLGYIDIEKVGQSFVAHVAQQRIGEDGKIYTSEKYAFSFNDLNNEFQEDLAAVGLHIGANNTNTPGIARFRGAEVSTVNQQENGVEYIGGAGDTFTFDHKASRIYKNGELFMRKDFGARFFELAKGMNTLIFNPTEAIDHVKVRWRDRFK